MTHPWLPLRTSCRCCLRLAVCQHSPRIDGVLQVPWNDSVAQDWRKRLDQLSQAINTSSSLCGGCVSGGMMILQSQTITMSLDTLDTPLADTYFLLSSMRNVSAANSSSRVDMLLQLLHWSDPGPGGFYDSLGESPRNTRHVRTVLSHSKAPAHVKCVRPQTA